MIDFNALVLDYNDTKTIEPTIKQVTREALSAGDVLIKVAYSSINYKDALTTNPQSGVVRSYPLIPGIDLSGVIVDPGNGPFKPGQEVIVTGYQLGVAHSGGFSEYAQVPNEWVIPLPSGLSLADVMILGTAGLTAALAVNAIERQGLRQHPNASILITGASGGVGSLAISILKKLGYHNLTALTRKKTCSAAHFADLGVANVLTPEELIPKTIKPLMAQTFDYVIDTVGGQQLEAIIPQISYDGSIALCGNAGGIAFNSTVLPYILRGVKMLGIDSVNISYEKRLYIWNRLASDMQPEKLNAIVKDTIGLKDLPEAFKQLLDGKMTGRYLVALTTPA